jgi:hypothetical protein
VSTRREARSPGEGGGRRSGFRHRWDPGPGTASPPP